MKDSINRYREYLKSELSSAALYAELAEVETDQKRSAIFRELSSAEISHANVWSTKLGVDTPNPKLDLVGKVYLVIAKIFGIRWVLPFLIREEEGEIDKYYEEQDALDVAQESRQHARLLKGLARGQTDPVPLWEGPTSRVGQSGSLRAAVLGINDGLISNFSLVMGVAGGTSNSEFVVFAGVAGLLAGAFSMAAGEYISMRSQRDLYEHEIHKESIEIRNWPDEETEELQQIYQAKGIPDEQAAQIARHIMADPEVALDTMVREELGLDPDQLGSPLGAALASFIAFAFGAAIPVIPYLSGIGQNALFVSASLVGISLLLVGGTLAISSGNRPYWGAVRMLIAGGAAGLVTFAIGTLIGVSLDHLA